MRNLKELRPLLTALYCINHTNNKDENIDKILKYAFNRIFDSNTNLLLLACAGRTKQEVLNEVKLLLKEDTKLELKDE